MQLSTVSRLKSYLETLSGSVPRLQALDAKRLPLFLRNRFSFYEMDLFGTRWSLACEDEAWDPGSPGEYEKQGGTLRRMLNSPVVFVLSELPSSSRNRMVQKGIPFIVPGTQAFLPSAIVDLRERFPRPIDRNRTSLSPTAQLTVLYHLERQSLSGFALKKIAEKLGCSAMTLSKVKDELEEAGICEAERAGRSMVLKFPDEKREVWKVAQDRLISPVKKWCWVRWERKPGYPALLAGVSALSRQTAIADDRLPTYAFGPKMMESFLEQGIIRGCRDAELATTKMEVWSYEPKLLGDNEVVDPLSLYLSLRHDPDERVQQQLEKLLEELPW